MGQQAFIGIIFTLIINSITQVHQIHFRVINEPELIMNIVWNSQQPLE